MSASPAAEPAPWADPLFLERLVQLAPLAFAFHSADLRYRRVNQAMASLDGVAVEDHLGRRPAEVLGSVVGGAVEAVLRQVLAADAAVVDPDFRPTGSDRDPAGRAFETAWFPVHDAAGDIVGVAVLASDVTARRDAERQAERGRERTERLLEASQRLATALTVAEVVRVAADFGVRAEGTQRIGTGDPADGVPDDPAERAMREALASQCALALERARLFEREQQAALSLQRTLLPARLPQVDGLGLAARYRPALAGTQVGGDWYDAFLLPDGRVAASLGDVMGKGLVAAAGMGRVRTAVRALALADPDPTAVLAGLDRFSGSEDGDELTTLVYLVVDAQTGVVDAGDAGHLPLVHLTAAGEARLVDTGPETTPVGVPEPRFATCVRLDPGDTLLAFTDGLVEVRGEALDDGLRALVEALAGASARGLDEVVEGLVEDFAVRRGGDDDVTALAIRRHPAARE